MRAASRTATGIFLAGMAAVVAAFAAAPVRAADPKAEITCDSRHNIITDLDRRFDEQPLFRGVTKLGNLVEVFASDEGSWTILVAHPSGFSCILSAGSLWDLSDPIWSARQTPASFRPIQD